MVTQSHSMHAVNKSTLYLYIPVTVSLEVLYLDSAFIMVKDAMAQSMYRTEVLCMYRGATRGLSPRYTFGPEIGMYIQYVYISQWLCCQTSQPVMEFVKIENSPVHTKYCNTNHTLAG